MYLLKRSFSLMLSSLMTVAAAGQSPSFAPLGNGRVNRYEYSAPHARKKGTVLLVGELIKSGERTKAVLTWQLPGSSEIPLDDEPIEFEYDQSALYWNGSKMLIDSNSPAACDPNRKTSGLIGSGESYKAKGVEWGPWKKYLLVDDSVVVLTLSATHGILEWDDYADYKDFVHHDLVRKFVIAGATKGKLSEVSSE